jgi:hypothetical protein
VRVASIFQFLAGRRAAILEIADDPEALFVGALLVLSAAFARNYDQASLQHQPWRLLGPFVASLAVSGPLFLTIYTIGWFKGTKGPGIGKAYRSFLSLYWMTAPLAWLYGVPYEAFLSPVDAVRANLWTLALVSIWRVALMVRVVSVIFNLRVRAALPFVMLVADIAALAALFLVPLPVISLMGGVNPEHEAIAVTALLVTFFALMTLPLCSVLAGLAPYSWRNVPEWSVPPTVEHPSGGSQAVAFAVVASVFWAALLPFTQPAQNLAWQVEHAYRASGPATALELMSAHDRSDFPFAWQPPPRRYPAEPTTSEILEVLEALADRPQADWVRAIYTKRLVDRYVHGFGQEYDEPIEVYAPRLVSIIRRLPEGPEIARAIVDATYGIEYLVREHPSTTSEQRSALRELLRLAGHKIDEPHAPLERASP